MGFQEAIEHSGWDADRRADALRLCSLMRENLWWGVHFPDPYRIYDNMDRDELIPPVAPPERPASHLKLLETLLDGDPPPREQLRQAIRTFCRNHKKEGPEDVDALPRALGRVWSLAGLNVAYCRARGLSLRDTSHVRDIIGDCDLHDQIERFQDVRLAAPRAVMWSCYDNVDQADPFHSFSANTRAEAVDRLGLGHYHDTYEELVRGGYRLPHDTEPHTPTAWDAGVGYPYWWPGGRTRPLSCDGLGTGDFTDEDGLREVVHDPIDGSQLAIPFEFLTD